MTGPSGPRMRVVATSACSTAQMVAAVDSRVNGLVPCTAW